MGNISKYKEGNFKVTNESMHQENKPTLNI